MLLGCSSALNVASPVLASAFPHAPTNAGAQVAFSLSSAGQVSARVLNLAGRPVKTLAQGREFDAGANTLLWNAQTDQGLAVPSGPYLVEVVARDDDGSEARAVTQLRIRALCPPWLFPTQLQG